MTSTREKILETALRRFNEEGLNSVGMREIADGLGLSPGNVTYYFRKKEDLVRALGEQLSERNDQTLDPQEREGTLFDFLESLEHGLDNNYRYRFLAAARAQILTEYASCSDSYATVDKRRRRQIAHALKRLRDGGELDSRLDDEKLSALCDALILMVRSVSADRMVHEFAEKSCLSSRHYVQLLAQVLELAASEEGRRQIERWRSTSPRSS